MSRLLPNFNYGSEIKNLNPTLYNQLRDSYFDTASVVNTKASKYVTNVAPPADAAINASLDIGDLWVNSLTDTAWIMTSRTTNTAATWKQIT